MQIYPPRRVRQRAPVNPSSGLDRFALVFAVFSAITLFGTLAMLCAVFTLAALLVRNDLRWSQMVGLAAVAPQSPLVIVESPLPTATDEPTATPTETATPEPTPEVPFETPTPFEPQAPVEAFETETPTPPPIPFPPADAGGSEFVAQATNQVGSMVASLNQLAALLSAPQIGDANWQLQLDSQVATVRDLYNTLLVLQPPPELETFHSNLVSVSAGCLVGLNTIEEAIRSIDETALQSGLTQVNSCLPALTDINSQLISGVYGGNVP